MRHLAFSSLLLLAIMVLLSGFAQADDFVSVAFEHADTFQSVHGVLVQGSTTTEVPSVKTRDLDSGVTEVRIPVPDDVAQDTLVGAVGKKESGEIVFTPLRSVKNKNSESPLALPDCKKEAVPLMSKQLPVSEQLSLLESIVHVRTDKKQQSVTALANILSGELLTRAQTLEKKFGLAEGKTDLSPTLPPAELVDRLEKLNDAIKRYNVARKPPPAASQ